MEENLFLNGNHRWYEEKSKKYHFYYTGFGFLKKEDEYISFKLLAKNIHSKSSFKEIKNILKNIDGHFSFVFIGKNKVIACVDWVRSYPLFYYIKNKNITISNNAKAIKKKFNLKGVNNLAAIDILAAGYATGKRTLYSNIHQIPAGKCLIKRYNSYELHAYENYSPKSIFNKNKQKYKLLKHKFVESLDKVFFKLTSKNKNRNIFLPLSAGYDSRLILSCLLRHGHKNITCYSYGLKNNTDMTIAKAICEKLSIRFIQINTSPKIIRKFSKSNFYKNYINYSDNYCSVPFIQDLPAIYHYQQIHKLPDDTLFINGNTGDFISGGHAPKELINKKKVNANLIRDIFIKKHFGLWDKFLYPPFKQTINERILELINNIQEQKEYISSAAIYEILEWEERQSKFVISGQRVYEYVEKDWRLPLWEKPVKDFFENLDYKYKLNQNFYKKVLLDLNWQQIWKDFPLNKKEIFPIWMRPLRYILKAFFLPVGKEKWHNFEKKYINYWTAYISSEALLPYFYPQKFVDNYRNAISLRALDYLQRHKALDLLINPKN